VAFDQVGVQCQELVVAALHVLAVGRRGIGFEVARRISAAWSNRTCRRAGVVVFRMMWVRTWRWRIVTAGTPRLAWAEWRGVCRTVR
jgi:hypothetical protein